MTNDQVLPLDSELSREAQERLTKTHGVHRVYLTVAAGFTDETTISRLLTANDEHLLLALRSEARRVHGLVLTKAQQRWKLDSARSKVCVADPTAGIFRATAWEAVEVASQEPGLDVYFMTADVAMARTFIADCERRCEPLPSSGPSRLDLASGHSIHSLPMRPELMRGKVGCYAILDASPGADVGHWIKATASGRIHGGRFAMIGHSGEGEFGEFVDSVKRGEIAASLHEVAAADGLS